MTRAAGDFPARGISNPRQVDETEGGEEETGLTAVTALTLVTLPLGDLLGDVLYLQQQLDALNGRDGGFGDRRGHPAGYKILGERHGIRESRHRDGLVGCAVCV